MTADDFRKLALELPEAVENEHMGHPDFRVRGKIFATLGAPDEAWGMVKLTLEQQEEFTRTAPEIFQAVSGGWGRRGATQVRLLAVKRGTVACVRQALGAAWRNTAPARLVKEFTDS